MTWSLRIDIGDEKEKDKREGEKEWPQTIGPTTAAIHRNVLV
jgi:hypothetical protein